MSQKRTVFLPYKLHQRHSLAFLAQKIPITVMLPPEKTLPENSKMEGIKINYRQFGTNFLKKIIKSEIRTLKYVKDLSKILDKINIDTLVTYEFYHWYTFQCINYKKQNPKIKLFVTSEMQMWPKNFIANILKRFLLLYFRLNIKHVNGIFVYTNRAYEFTKKHIPKAKIVLLPTPIDVEIFKPTTNRQFYRNNELRLLMNARFSSYKRHADLFDAISILKKEGKNIKVTCISRYKHDKESISKLIKQKKLQDIVRIANPIFSTKEMADLYKSYDILVLPSHNEAIGLVVPEAMACGTPTITSDTVGANVYVKNKKTGRIFKTGDVNELANCIRDCFNSNLLETYSKNAINHIQTKFTLETYAERFKNS